MGNAPGSFMVAIILKGARDWERSDGTFSLLFSLPLQSIKRQSAMIALSAWSRGQKRFGRSTGTVFWTCEARDRKSVICGP